MKELIALEAEKINKSFTVGNEDIQVLNDISFQVMDSQFVSIMGPSGCGKSTLLYILGGLDKPTSGHVHIYNEDFINLSEKRIAEMRRTEIGFIFQFYNLVPNLIVEDNILMPLLINGENVKYYKDKLDEIMDFVEISHKAKVTPRELSGGQQQRVAIARALITQPRILFADEPIGNLDMNTGKKIMELFLKINEKLKTTIVQVTHSEEAALYGDSILRIRDGIIEDFSNFGKEKGQHS